MGREWYRPRRSLRRGETEIRDPPPAPGCMNGILQLLHFRQLLLFPSQRRPTPPPPTTITTTRRSSLKGGSRSSLELDVQGTEPSVSVLAEGEERHNPIRIRLVPAAGSVAAPAAAGSKKTRKKVSFEEDRESLQGETPRTSNVVARLMGLDMLPTQTTTTTTTTPRYCNHPPPLKSHQAPPDQKKKTSKKRGGKAGGSGESQPQPPRPRKPLAIINCNILEPAESRYESGSRSLPGTPRMSSSSERRRSCDGEPPRRLSLQLSKHSSAAMQEFDYLCEIVPEGTLLSTESRKKDRCRRQLPALDENRSPSHRAREIVKQVKESVGKRTGRLDGNALMSDETKQSRSTSTPTTNKSPARRLVDDNIAKDAGDPMPAPSFPPPSSPFLRYRGPQIDRSKIMGPVSTTCKKPISELFTERFKKPSSTKTLAHAAAASMTTSAAQPEPLLQMVQKYKAPPFIHSFTATIQRRTSAPCSSSLSSPKQIVRQPPKPTQELVHNRPREGPLKQAGLSQSLISSSRNERRRREDDHADDPGFWYVKSILECTGVLQSKTSPSPPPPTLARWYYSLSHPIDPIIFHRFELSLTDSEEEVRRLGHLRHRCNRKLLFHLVDEILGDLLRPCLDVKPNCRQSLNNNNMMMMMNKKGEVLLRYLWSKIRSFPSADCHDMQDIDALVGGDLPETDMRGLLLHPAVKEERESIAVMIEADIFDSLVGEAAASIVLLLLLKGGGRRIGPRGGGCC